MKKNKILILSSMYPNKINPNAGIFIHNHVKYLLKAGCRVRVISPVPYVPKVLGFKTKWMSYNRIPAYDVIDEVNVDYPRYICFPRKWSRTVSCYTMYWGIQKTLNSVINKYQLEIFHMHKTTPDGYLGLLLKKKYGLPLICSMRGSDINIYPYHDRLTMLLTKKVIAEADQLVSVSYALKTVAESIAKPKYPIKVVYNGCDLSRFVYNEEDRIRVRNKFEIQKKEKIIIFVGNISKNKGVFELINAFTKVNMVCPGLRLIFVGNGPEYRTIKSIISSNDLNNKIHLVGNQPNNEVAHFLSAGDIFVLPTYNEGMPNVIFEAMACGLPVLATRVGGIPEVVTEATGILIPTKNTELLEDGIERMLSTKWDRKKIRRHIESFTWERNAEKTIQIYNNILSNSRN